MAGLAAAHELAERGFAVTVYERNALGGKARSDPGRRHRGRRAPATCPASTASASSPASTTTSRTRCGASRSPGNPNGVYDNLVAAERRQVAARGRPPRRRLVRHRPRPAAGADASTACAASSSSELGGTRRPAAGARLLRRAPAGLRHQLRRAPLRPVGARQLVGLHQGRRQVARSTRRRSPPGLTRNLVAAKETVASTRTIGHMGEAFVWNIMGRGNDGAPDRVLNLPTNEAWIDPWVVHLQEPRRALPVGRTVEALERRGRPHRRRAHARPPRPPRTASRPTGSSWPCRSSGRGSVLGPKVRALDPALNGARRACSSTGCPASSSTCARKVDITRGHMTFLDAPWALTALTQGAVLGRRATSPATTATGRAVDCLSVDISDWDTPGMLYGKPAKQCTRDEIATRGAGRRSSRTTPPATSCTDDIVHSWFLDPGIQWVQEPRREPQRRRRCSSTRSARGRSARRRTRRSRTCSWPATTCRPTSTWRRWRAATSRAARRSPRCCTRRARRATPPHDVQALRAAGVRAGQGGRRAALPARPAERARRRLTAAERADAIVVGARCAGLGGGDRAGARRAARRRARPRQLPRRHDLDPPAVAGRRRRAAGARRARARRGARRAAAAATRWPARASSRCAAATRPSTAIDHALCVRRPGLDAALVETARAAGAEVREGVRVTELVLRARPRRRRALDARRARAARAARRRRRRAAQHGRAAGRAPSARTARSPAGARASTPTGRTPRPSGARPPRSGARAPSSARRSRATTASTLVLLQPPVARAAEFRGDLAGDYARTRRRDPGARRAPRRLPPGDARSARPPASSPTSAARPGRAGRSPATPATSRTRSPRRASATRCATGAGSAEAAAPVLDDPRALDAALAALGARPRRRLPRDLPVDEPAGPRRADVAARGRALPPRRRGPGAGPPDARRLLAQRAAVAASSPRAATLRLAWRALARRGGDRAATLGAARRASRDRGRRLARAPRRLLRPP